MNWTSGFTQRNPIDRITLAACSTMRVGGHAELITLESRDDLVELCAAEPRFLGKGANLLIGDGDLGRVAKLGTLFDFCHISNINDDEALVHVGGAHDLGRFIGICVKAGLRGPEGLAGVPATIGGALCMNAGTTTTWTFDHVQRVEVVLPGSTGATWLERKDLKPVYRHSGLPAGTLFLSCEMILQRGDPEELRATASRLKQAKAASQPLAMRSAGCIFKNPGPELPAGKIVDQLGFKGERIGDAMVSDIHANFIVNCGAAQAVDVLRLVKQIRARCWETHEIFLAMEVQTWGCDLSLTIPDNLPEGVADVG